MPRTVIAKPEHEVLFQDLVALVGKHSDKVSAVEMLAIAANLIGKLIAMQDQRTMTREMAMRVVLENLQFGNKQVVDQLEKTPTTVAN